MNNKIDAYGFICDQQTAALIHASGDLSWLCWPEFDSEACFASLLGSRANGHWSLAPQSPGAQSRHYLPGTLVLETTHTDASGAIAVVTDFMPRRELDSCVVRIVRGKRGNTRMETCFAPRFDYGSAQPRLNLRSDRAWEAVAGPHLLLFRSDIEMKLEFEMSR